MQKINMLHLCHMKGHEKSIIIKKHGTRLASFSCYQQLKRPPQKPISYTEIWVKTYPALYMLLQWIVSTFLRSLVFIKTVFYAKTNCFWKYIQNKECHLGYWPKFCLRLHQLFVNKDFCTKTRLCNNFKSTWTKDLIVISKSSCILQTSWKTTSLRQPINFLGVVVFLAIFCI